MNRVFYNNIDHSEALTNFINEQSEILDIGSKNWTISREGKKDFKVKCSYDGEVFSEVGRDCYSLVHQIVHKIKQKERKKQKAAS